MIPNKILQADDRHIIGMVSHMENVNNFLLRVYDRRNQKNFAYVSYDLSTPNIKKKVAYDSRNDMPIIAVTNEPIRYPDNNMATTFFIIPNSVVHVGVSLEIPEMDFVYPVPMLDRFLEIQESTYREYNVVRSLIGLYQKCDEVDLCPLIEEKLDEVLLINCPHIHLCIPFYPFELKSHLDVENLKIVLKNERSAITPNKPVYYEKVYHVHEVLDILKKKSVLPCCCE